MDKSKSANDNAEGFDRDHTDAKRRKLDNNGTEIHQPLWYHPSSFVTWNCNGFSSRARYNQELLHKLVNETQNPDVICIQEARLKASGPGEQRGKPLKDKDHEHVQTALSEPFRLYTPFWSLADKKYAGTLTLVRKTCLTVSGSSTENNIEGSYDANFVAYTPRSAIDLILRRLGTTRSDCGIDEGEKVAGVDDNTQNPPSPCKKPAQQTSLKSFFAPKKKSVTSSAKRKHYRHDHNAEGRFQFFFFPGMDFVQTYVPNNGTKEESFRRRRQWDRDMTNFVRDRNKILYMYNKNKGNDGDNRIDSSLDRKILWCGT